MKKIVSCILLTFCVLSVSAQTDNVTRKKSQQQTATVSKSKTSSSQSSTQSTRKQTKQQEQDCMEAIRQENMRKEQEEREQWQRMENQRLEQLRQRQAERERMELAKQDNPTIGNSTYTPAVKTYKVKGVSFQMIEVRGGTFRMGGTSEQERVLDNEKPVHSVTLDSYYIAMTEVTQALWKAVMGKNPSRYKGNNKPVDSVNWRDCQEFISKLNSLTGQSFRLPTEAEWEFAARGGIMSKGYKYSGSDCIDEVASYERFPREKKSSNNVAELLPNELGIYDMSGNVGEWVADWYSTYGSTAQLNPTGPSSGTDRVVRGGDWRNNGGWSSRISSRVQCNPVVKHYERGLRLALSE